jgi:beta-glucanase (GH16 family)
MRAKRSVLPLLTLAAAGWACDVGVATDYAPLAGAAGNAAGAPAPDEVGGTTATTGGATVTTGGGALAATGGGLASTAGTGGAAPPTGGTFTLLFRDEFERLDLTRWQLMTHSWDTNLALFSDQTAAIEDGKLVLSLLPAPAGTVDSSNAAKPYLGAELRSLDTLTYGRVRARLEFAKGSAVVSSLVTIYTPWPADDWNELDMECLGASPAKLQLNTMVYTGAPSTPPVTTSVSPTAEPYAPALDFDPTADFHVYAIEWTPESARFSIDDTLVHTWTTHIDRLKLPQNVLLTIWASSSASWAGAVSDDTSLARARYDWVELYTYQP